MFKRIVSLFIIMISMIAFGITAFADEKGMNYLYTDYCYSSLTVSG